MECLNTISTLAIVFTFFFIFSFLFLVQKFNQFSFVARPDRLLAKMVKSGAERAQSYRETNGKGAKFSQMKYTVKKAQKRSLDDAFNQECKKNQLNGRENIGPESFLKRKISVTETTWK